jgi:hypothetical protein
MSGDENEKKSQQSSNKQDIVHNPWSIAAIENELKSLSEQPNGQSAVTNHWFNYRNGWYL